MSDDAYVISMSDDTVQALRSACKVQACAGTERLENLKTIHEMYLYYTGGLLD